MIKKSLNVRPKICIGCRTCELACFFVHRKQDQQMATSRVKIFPNGPEKFIPYICLQCVDAACAKPCPTGAITLNEQTGAIEIREQKCIRCGACEIACPFGNIFVDREEKSVFKCDLCGGDPACAKFCPSGALKYEALP
jgi:anaerobic carbon-monoxide dehydrogenase iron sulfur subunit